MRGEGLRRRGLGSVELLCVGHVSTEGHGLEEFVPPVVVFHNPVPSVAVLEEVPTAGPGTLQGSLGVVGVCLITLVRLTGTKGGAEDTFVVPASSRTKHFATLFFVGFLLSR